MKSADLFGVDVRPGDFAGNAAALLAAARDAARAGAEEIKIAADALRGGDCGSLNSHPAFQEALAKAQRDFLRRFPRGAKAKFVARASAPSLVENDPAADPRRPFNAPPAQVFEAQVRAFAKRMKSIGCRAAVVGLSGGLDSALALLVAHEAFVRLGLPPENLRVLTMPGFGTTKRTKGNAGLLAKGLGLKLKTVGIAPSVRRHFRDVGHDGKTPDVTYENAQARMRTLILMDVANLVGGIVVGTGDMSEIALGWCTYNGDHMSMFGVNAGVPKTVVREVCAWWARTNPGVAADALMDVIATPVSPELLPATADGEIAQKTEDRVGPYELHDFFLWHFVREAEGRAEILRAAAKAFRGTYQRAVIAKWLDVFMRRFFTQAFKRNCAPDGARVFEVYLSPHDFWIPSDSFPAKI